VFNVQVFVLEASMTASPLTRPSTRQLRALTLTGLLVLSAPAARADGLDDLANNLLNFGSGGIGGMFPAISTGLALLNTATSIASMIPMLGPIANIFQQVLGVINNVQVTLGPIMQAAQTAGTFLKSSIDAKNTVKNLFASRDINDVMSNVQTLTNQVGGLGVLPANFQKTFATDPRAAVDSVRAAVDTRISQLATTADAARRQKDVSGYRTALQQIDELQGMRGRLRHLGESAAATLANAKTAERTQQMAQRAAQNSLTLATSLVSANDAASATKLVGAIGVQQLNTMSAGFDALSNQLAQLSKQQTVTNEQNDQLLAHYQQTDREAAAKDAMLIDQDAQRRDQEARSMKNSVRALSQGISTSLNPSREKQSDFGALMRGAAK
jgi:hypothetical protein